MQKFTKTAIVALLAAGAAASAHAGMGSMSNPSTDLIGHSLSTRGSGSAIDTGFEGTEGWILGPLPQNGWQLGVGDGGFDVVATNKNGSINSLQLHKNAAAAQGNAQLAFSPLNSDSTRTRVCFDFKMDDAAGANYAVIAQSPSQALLTWRVEFDYGGNIFVLDLDNTGTAIQFVDTGISWATGYAWKKVQVDIDTAGGTIEYRYNNALIYTGALFAGTANEQIVLRHDNWQDFAGNTSFSGGAVAAYFDNLELKAVPAPGAFALLGLGGLVAGRRRRA